MKVAEYVTQQQDVDQYAYRSHGASMGGCVEHDASQWEEHVVTANM